MKYTLDIIIYLPTAQVTALFNNPDHMKKWQPELTSLELLDGNPGEEGAKSKLHYDTGKREVDMIETIIKNNLPEEMVATYETKGVTNTMSNKFESINESQTRWISENEFQFTGFMKLLSIFMQSAFPKQTLKVMNQFKQFAEKEQY